MFFNGTTKLLSTFIISIIFLTIFLILKSFYFYKEINLSFEEDIKNEARVLSKYVMVMRNVYQKQFLKSGIEINEKTLGLLPAHASSLISNKFSNFNNYYIRNVSDRPRNIKNKADKEEQKAIDFFNKNEKLEYFDKYEKNAKEYYQFATRINVELYCLQCHGKRENAPVIIQEIHKDLAYNYKVGDLRGIVSIKIPKENVNKKIDSFLKRELIYIFTVIILVASLLYLIYKRTITIMTHTEKVATDYAMRDSLTGLYNRHYLKNLNFATITNIDYYVVFFDIDFFKKVNDLYGHLCGDLILKEFSKILSSYTRDNDILCRYGGEEFILIIKNIDKKILKEKLEEVRISIESNDFIFQNKKIKITTSIGFAKSEDKFEFEKVLEHADNALYSAKKSGRNKTVEYHII